MMESRVYFTTLFVVIGAFQVASSSAKCCGLYCSIDSKSPSCTSERPNSLVMNNLESILCHDKICCETNLNNRYGTLKADSLTLDLHYPDRNSGPTLTAKWEYDTVPQGNIKVFISVHDGELYCFHPNNATTTVTLTRLPDPLLQKYSCRGYDVKVQVILYNNTYGFLSKTIFVGDCWSVMGNRSLNVCGVQVPSPPINVSAVLSVDSSTNVSTLTVEWSPPLYHNTPIKKYYIELYSTETKIVSELISPSVTKYSVTNRNTTGASNITAVRVMAGASLDWDCQFCCTIVSSTVASSTIRYSFRPPPTYHVSSVSISPSPPGPSSTRARSSTSPPTNEENQMVKIAVPVAAVVLAVIVCMALLFVFFVTFSVKKCHRKGEYDCLSEQTLALPDIEDQLMKPPFSGSVFIVASTEEDEEMQYKLRYLVHDLADNGIESVYYEYERTSHGPESPAALGISQWVELQFQKCDLVLFAFTKRFLEEWKRESMDQLSPVVWSSRHVLDGLLPHQGNISKFGVVLMGENCTIPPGLKRFQVFRLFNGDSPTIHSEHLIRYILETPPYAPPRVSTVQFQLRST